MTRWDAVVQDVLDQARRAAGGGGALAAALKAAEVGPEVGAYSESAVSNWIIGRTRPPANVVLAAASLYGLSLDGPLTLPTTGTVPSERPAPPDEIEQLRSTVDRLEALLHDHITDQPSKADTKDVRAVYSTRAEAQAAVPLIRTLASSERLDAMGLALNAICQGISDVLLAELIENGLTMRCLFLEPGSSSGEQREAEEGVPGAHAEMTRTNIRALQRIRERLSPEARHRLQLRTYDETLRFNIMVFDDRALVQVYLPHQRGIDAPTFLVEADDHHPTGLFPVFSQVVADTWERGRDID